MARQLCSSCEENGESQIPHRYPNTQTPKEGLFLSALSETLSVDLQHPNERSMNVRTARLRWRRRSRRRALSSRVNIFSAAGSTGGSGGTNGSSAGAHHRERRRGAAPIPTTASSPSGHGEGSAVGGSERAAGTRLRASAARRVAAAISSFASTDR